MGVDSQWTSVRVRKATLARLVAFSRRTLRQVTLETAGAERRPDGRVSLDAAICVLLHREELHAARSARSRKPGNPVQNDRIAYSDESE